MQLFIGIAIGLLPYAVSRFLRWFDHWRARLPMRFAHGGLVPPHQGSAGSPPLLKGEVIIVPRPR